MWNTEIMNANFPFCHSLKKIYFLPSFRYEWFDIIPILSGCFNFYYCFIMTTNIIRLLFLFSIFLLFLLLLDFCFLSLFLFSLSSELPIMTSIFSFSTRNWNWIVVVLSSILSFSTSSFSHRVDLASSYRFGFRIFLLP